MLHKSSMFLLDLGRNGCLLDTLQQSFFMGLAPRRTRLNGHHRRQLVTHVGASL